ncbi:MAG: hypothetical protein E7062_05745 [Spirochaetaceae bacterium]|nr:hypothetical protein [Spirochaetaceae bacterium]
MKKNLISFSCFVLACIVLGSCATTKLTEDEKRQQYGLEKSPAVIGTIRFSEQFSYKILAEDMTELEVKNVEVPKEMITSAPEKIKEIYGQVAHINILDNTPEVKEIISDAVKSNLRKETARGVLDLTLKVGSALVGENYNMKEATGKYTFGRNYVTKGHKKALFNLAPEGYEVFDPVYNTHTKIFKDTKSKLVLSFGYAYDFEYKKTELGIATRLVVYNCTTHTSQKNNCWKTNTWTSSNWIPYKEFIANPAVLLDQLPSLVEKNMNYTAKNQYKRTDEASKK